ncbi:calmin [Clinocottus analis]|uniref:calmin n=1 Tax=Clinocottus analis TaxID=304258 RepID=UPI0035BF078C
MAGHEWEDWFEREEFIGQISDIRVQNLQVERELVQKRTFTRWMNLHLEKCDPPIEVNDLFRDIQDGHILMALLEELSGCKLLHGFKRSSHRIFRLNNIAKVLSFLEERNVKLVSIDAADVADGNSSIILGLIWNIILFFQIKELTGNIRSQFPSSSSLSSIPTASDSDTSQCSTPSDERQSVSAAMREHSKAIKKLLQWVQKRTRKYSVAVRDFGKSWTSGLAFLAVIKSIDPSLVDMRKALLRTAKENLEDGFRIAHFSLGIPRLLEPDDVTINAPDEQSIMTYVSQFLKHFPGEPEEPVQLIERSVSMGRLNFRDSDSNHMRNNIHLSRVKERSHMFERVRTQQPPKILISSVSEDRSAMSPPFRPAAARSWSSEDILADHPHVEDSNVVEEPKESASEVRTNPTSDSPQLSYTHSPTGSSVPESVTSESVVGDSAISSPDSWVESEFGATPERFCESRSDGSLCDSGSAWDVYRATPVEVTTLDEGCVLSMEDRASDEQSITESYVDEGICSLSSLESAQERVQGHFEKKQAEVVKEKEANLDEYKQGMLLEQVPDHSKVVQSQQTDASQSKEQAPSLGLSRAEELTSAGVESLQTDQSNQIQLKQTSVEESTVDFIEGAKEHVGRIDESQEKDSLSEDTRGESREESGILKEREDDVVGTQDKPSEGVLREDPDAQERASEASLDPGMNIPLISISSEPEEQDAEGRCEAERQDEVQQPEGTNTDVDRPQNPHELSRDSNDDVEIPSCPASDNDKPRASEQIGEEHDASRSLKSDISEPDTRTNTAMSEAKQERESPHHDSHTGTSEKDLTSQTSSPHATSQPVDTEQEMGSTHRPDGHQDPSSDSHTATTQQNSSDPVDSKSNGTMGIWSNEAGRESRDADVFSTNFDQCPPTEEPVGDPIEPMDLFYPDKEEPMFAEPPDTEMQSWPSVLSVSALQPAPASETQPEQPLSLPGGLDSIPEDDEVITKQETDGATSSQERCLLPGEQAAGLQAAADGSELGEAEQQSSAGEKTQPVRSDIQDESQIAPVLRHRKGARFTDCADNQPAVTAAAGGADVAGSDTWCSESWELYVLLLLWLLLYCFWLLPQMDLKTLPGLLLNLDP